LSYHSQPETPRLSTKKQQGFTLVELVVTITLTLIISTTFYTYFKSSFIGYLNLQRDSSGLTDLAIQSQRIASVVRGATDITSVASDDLVMYGYFYPTDAYVSIVHYYLNSSSTILYADVTPMTANPPIGTPITANKKTYKIIDSFNQTPGLTLFNYLDSNGTVLTLPIIDLHNIKGVRINLAVATSSKNNNEAVNVDVSLRNRKTNL
jgi:prepilin-type N-terminal cleavage/methylation domain-containing protein